MPLTFSNNNINWDGNLVSSYLLNSANGFNNFILAPGLSAEDLAALNALVDQYDSTPTAPIAATAGYQDVLMTPVPVGATATGLANDATVYTATITVDGVAIPVSVVGSAAQTYTTLVAEINTDLGVAAVASITSTGLRVTSATTGLCSSVSIADGISSFPLFGSLRDTVVPLSLFVQIVAPVGGSAAYTTITPTYGKLVVNFANVTDPTGLAGSVATAGYQDTLFAPVLAGFGPPPLVGPLAAPGLWDFVVAVDGGVATPHTITGPFVDTAAVITAMNTTAVPPLVGAVASYVAGQIRVTSLTTGALSSIAMTSPVTANPNVFTLGYAAFEAPSIFTGFATAVAGADADTTTYTAQFTFDGVVADVSVLGSSAQTFATLATEVQTDLAAAVPGTTAAIVGTTLVIQAPASVQRVRMTNNGLFAATARFAGISVFDGAATLRDALIANRAINGENWLDYLSDNMGMVGCRPKTPARRVNVYSDGVNWYWFANNALTSVVPPPVQ